MCVCVCVGGWVVSMWVWVGGGCRSWIIKMSDVRSLDILVVNTCNKDNLLV